MLGTPQTRADKYPRGDSRQGNRPKKTDCIMRRDRCNGGGRRAARDRFRAMTSVAFKEYCSSCIATHHIISRCILLHCVAPLAVASYACNTITSSNHAYCRAMPRDLKSQQCHSDSPLTLWSVIQIWRNAVLHTAIKLGPGASDSSNGPSLRLSTRSGASFQIMPTCSSSGERHGGGEYQLQTQRQ